MRPTSSLFLLLLLVTTAVAESQGLEDVSDLGRAGLDRFGGPPECMARPLCLRGLADIYGVSFAQFIPQPSLLQRDRQGGTR